MIDRVLDRLQPTPVQPAPAMGSAGEAGVLFDRVVAVCVDVLLCYLLVVVPLFYVGGALLGGLEALGGAVGLLSVLVFFPVYVTYSFAFEWRFGRTPGKVNRRLVVVMADGTPCTLRASAVRNLLRYVDLLGVPPMVLGLLLAFVFDGRRVGDLVAGTLVVRAVASAAGPGTPTAHPDGAETSTESE